MAEPIHIFIICYNESILLPQTIKHYKTMLPNSIVTLYDNESTDKTVEIARDLGCKVISWSSGKKIDDYKYLKIKNNCWKHIKKGWVIVCDMDEWLCVNNRDLLEEESNGTTILSIEGYNITGNSKNLYLKDIDLHSLNRGYFHIYESKHLCFHLPEIKEINYGLGSHTSKPEGIVKYSSKKYLNKHMNTLGLPYLINKMKMRYKRAANMRKKSIATHYMDNTARVKDQYIREMKKTRKLRCNAKGYCYTRKVKK